MLFRIIQRECFQQEVADLSAGRKVQRTSRLYSLRPFIDSSGMLRVKRRLEWSEFDQSVKNPLVLADHYLTTLLLRYTHRSRMHQGVEGCLSFLQQRFWILRGRRLLRRIKSSCVICRRHDARAASEETAPLPSDRIVYQRPFAVTGVDHAGPLLVKARGSVRVKAWIVLFVCATVRAVHLELVESTSAGDFLLAFRRFTSRYGKPMLIRSHNGAGFVAAARNVSCEWKFNPPASPWHGGFYERLVGLIKAPLKKVLGSALLSWDELVTILTEVQRIVNDRPLTYVGDGDDMPPLTPNSLLGERYIADVEDDALESPIGHHQANVRFRYLNRLREHFLQRWTCEYLLGLRYFHQSRSHSLAVGDIVLIMDDLKKRSKWKMARIMKIFSGRDGGKRVVLVRAGNR